MSNRRSPRRARYPNDGEDRRSDEAASRDSRAHAIAVDCLRRRMAGEVISEVDLLAEHADLEPELSAALAHLQTVEQALFPAQPPASSATGEQDQSPQSAASTTSSRDRRQNNLSVRCPHCHAPLGVPATSAWDDLTCSACRSHFSLVDLGASNSGQSVITTVGHFELVEPLGAGGFGTVWKALDKELDRWVAIKIPRSDRLSPDQAEQFFREARAAAELRHSHIVSVHAVGRDKGRLYIVSEYVAGGSLAEWLADQRMTFREAATLCQKIALALEHAHQAGVIHRDLKPANILLSVDGEPYLTDFGLARRDIGETTVTLDGQLLGTPAYMSPEQARGEAHVADHRADIYSLGVILFELLTGELPFRGSTRMLLKHLLEDEPPHPRSLNGGVPRDLATIALKCLEKDPGRRYASAQELADDLGRYLRGAPIAARPTSRLERTWRWCKRYPWKAAACGLALLVVVAAPLLTWRETVRRKAIVAQERDTYRRLYFSDMHNAVESLANGNVGQVMELLDRHRPQPAREDLRGFEWYCLWRQCQRGRSQRTLQYGKRVHCLAVSPDGRSLAAGGDDYGVDNGAGKITYDVKVWDPVTGIRRHTFSEMNGWVEAVAFSPDGTSLACRCGGAVQLWDLSSDELLLDISDSSWANKALAFSRDGKILAAITDDHGIIRLWDATTRQELRKIEAPQTESMRLAFSPKGNLLASAGSDGDVRLWDPSIGKLSFSLRTDSGNATPICFTLDGTTLITGGVAGTMVVWDLASHAPRQTLDAHTKAITSLALSRDGKLLASASVDGVVKLWDTQRFELHDTLLGSTGAIEDVAFFPDGRTLAAGGADGVVRLWDLSSPLPRDTLQGHEDGLFCVAVSPDGKQVASGADDGAVKLWDMASGKVLHTLAAHDGNVWCVAFDTSGKVLATGGADQLVRLWDTGTGEQQGVLEGHTSWVFVVSFTPDGKSLVSASNDNTLRVWDLQSHKCLRILPNIGGVGAAVSPDGRVVAVDRTDGTVEVRDLLTFELLRSTTPVEPVVAESFAFSPNSQLLAWATGAETRDMTVKVWDWTSGRTLRALVGHTDYVYSVAFSPDGRTLASASYDGTLRLWDAATGEERAALRGHSGHVLSVAFTPDGRTLVSGSRDKTIRLWRAASEEDVLAGKATRASSAEK